MSLLLVFSAEERIAPGGVLTVQQLTSSGVVPVYVAATLSGDVFANNGRAFVHAKNGAGSPTQITVISRITCDQRQTHNTDVVVSSGGERMIGPFSDRYTDGHGNVTLVYSSVTSLTIAALAL